MGDSCSTLGREHGRSLWGLRGRMLELGGALPWAHTVQIRSWPFWRPGWCELAYPYWARPCVQVQRLEGRLGAGGSRTWGSLPSPNPSPWQQAKGRRAACQSWRVPWAGLQAARSPVSSASLRRRHWLMTCRRPLPRRFHAVVGTMHAENSDPVDEGSWGQARRPSRPNLPYS